VLNRLGRRTGKGKRWNQHRVASARRKHSVQYERRSFEIDVLQCPCGARRAIIAFITDPDVVQAILECLGLPTGTPFVAPARPPPQTEFVFEYQV